MLRLEIFTREELDLIHESSLEILEQIGVVMQEHRILGLMHEAGAEVNDKEQLIKIPRNLVQEALKNAPRHFTLYSRDSKKQLELGEEGRQYYTTGGAVPHVLDHRTGERRAATSQDTVERVRMIDALDNIDSIETSPGIWPQDIPVGLRDVYVSLLTFENTTKHYGLETVGPAESHEYCIKMAETVAGGAEDLEKYPIIHASAEPIGPQLWDEHALRNMWTYARRGLPVDIASVSIMGLTSPTTFVGTIVHGNVGFLSGLVAAQLINKGTPVGRFGSSVPTDLKSGKAIFGSVEYGLLSLVTGQIGKYYGIPTMDVAGIPDTNTVDAQAGHETAITMLMAALGGVNRIQNGGLLAAATITSLEKLVIDDEIIGMVKTAIKGIEVSKEKIGLDLIKDLGPHGSFMQGRKNLEFTRKYLRTEHYIPNLSLRIDWDQWQRLGKKTIVEAAKEKVDTLLKAHQPEQLSKDIKKDLRRIFEESKRTLL